MRTIEDYEFEHVIREYMVIKLGKFLKVFEFILETIAYFVVNLTTIIYNIRYLLLKGSYKKDISVIKEYEDIKTSKREYLYLKRDYKGIESVRYLKVIFSGIISMLFSAIIILYIGIPVGFLRIIYKVIGRDILRYTLKILAFTISLVIVFNIIEVTNGFDIETIKDIINNNILSNEYVKKYLSIFPKL